VAKLLPYLEFIALVQILVMLTVHFVGGMRKITAIADFYRESHIIPRLIYTLGWISAIGIVATVIIAASAFFVVALRDEPITLYLATIFLLFFGTTFYITVCELLLGGFAKFLTEKRGEQWVKEMEYIYLGLGAIGIFGSLNRIEFIGGRLSSKTDIFGPLILVSAIVLRLIKTRAEIAGWNKVLES
jgi:hypothetical protein